MKESLVRSGLVIAIPLFFVMCSNGVTGLADEDARRLDPSDDTMLHLTGEGNLNTEDLAPELVLNALKTFNDNVSGSATVPKDGGKIGTVVELVAPNATYSHWCVNVLMNEVPDILPPGFNTLVYIRDIGDGQTSFDQIAFGGDFGATCAANPAPPEVGDFRTLPKGDFKGTIRTR